MSSWKFLTQERGAGVGAAARQGGKEHLSRSPLDASNFIEHLLCALIDCEDSELRKINTPSRWCSVGGAGLNLGSTPPAESETKGFMWSLIWPSISSPTQVRTVPTSMGSDEFMYVKHSTLPGP